MATSGGIVNEFWQPNPGPLTRPMVVPMFPLRGVFLFPGQVLPLHIFEPRYRQMVEDLLDGPGRLVMATILEDSNSDESDECPPVLPIAGLGEIARHERLPDDRFTVLLFGLARVQLQEVDSDRLYRKVRCEVLQENAPPEALNEELHGRLLSAIHERTGFEIDHGDQVSSGQLADILAQTLTVPQGLMEEIFTECEVEIRAERVLAAHEEFPSEPKE